METNIIIGSFLILLGTLSIIVAFLIAIRQYIVPVKSAQKMTMSFVTTDIIKLLLQLFDDILKAPPALAFLVAGLILIGSGILVITTLPF